MGYPPFGVRNLLVLSSLGKGLYLQLESASCEEEQSRKLWWAAPLASSGQYGKEGIVVFEDAPFSYIRLKHSIISSLLYWAGIIPNVDTSFVRTLSSLYMIDPRS